MARRTRKFFFDNVRGKLLKNTNKGVKDSANEGNTVSDFASDAIIHSTGSFSDVNTKMMTAAAIDDRIVVRTNELVDSAPETLNTLNELAAALGDDANYSTTTSTALGNRLRIDVNDQSLTTTQKSNAVTNLGLATVSTTGAYSDLTGTPTIPTNNNELTNGAGYITGYTVTESDVTGHQAALSITESQISDLGSYSTFSGAYADLTGKPTIPTNNNQLTNGAGYSTFSGSYNDLSNRPTIPTNNNQLTNGAGYITSADGGNADTVDGIHASSFQRLDVSGTIPDGVVHTYECYGNIATASGGQSSLQVYNSGAGTDAFLTFHVGADYAAYLGVDGGINDLAYGGWSAGAVSNRVYHAGNTPSQTVTVAGVGRNSHHTGHLVGSYNSVGANDAKSNPIYTIGSNYNPSDAALGNMYGIGYSHPNATFISLTGASGWGMYVAADGDARVWLDGSSGNISGTGNITAYASDGRLKTNVTPIENAIDKVKKIRGVTFDWIDNITSEYDFHPSSMHETGVIAQEIQEVIPDAVVTAPFNGNYARKSGVDHNFLTVDKDKIIPLLIEAIKEQQSQIEELKEMIGGTSK